MKRVAAAAIASLLCALLAVPGIATAAPRVSRPVSMPEARGPDLTAFEGLGAWIDIYDPWAFSNPISTVRRTQRHGVQTLFVETSNFSRDFAIYQPNAMSRLLKAAHAKGMDVIAWYLPGFYNVKFDFRRSMAAIRFKRNGQSFDGFGLDIEHSGVTPVSRRSDRLVAISRRLDANTRPNYPLSAIIPSPRGIELAGGYWPDFPYSRMAPYYDVWQPMTYYTYRVTGYVDVLRYTQRNTQILRDETGDPSLLIHQIGGIANRSNGRETGAFVDAILADGLIGGSIYDLGLTGPEDWAQLERLAKP